MEIPNKCSCGRYTTLGIKCVYCAKENDGSGEEPPLEISLEELLEEEEANAKD